MTPTVASPDSDDDSIGACDDLLEGDLGEAQDDTWEKFEDPGYAKPFARVTTPHRQILDLEVAQYDLPFEPSGVERMKDGFLRLKEKEKSLHHQARKSR